MRSGAPGLRVISAPNTTLRGFVVNRFTSGGIVLTNSPSAVIAGNYIGTDVAGAAALANGSFGISIEPGSDNSLIGGAAAADRNLISGNANRGIYVQAVANVVIQGNRIGTNAAGTAAISNGNGVEAASSTGLLVGGATPGEGNLISGNSFGVYLNGTTGSTVRGNLIGTDAAGTGSIANSGFGIYSYFATGTTVGGAAPGDGNVIAGSSYAIYLYSPTGGIVRGNFIGVAADAVTPLPNGLGIYIFQGTGVSVGGVAPGEAQLHRLQRQLWRRHRQQRSGARPAAQLDLSERRSGDRPRGERRHRERPWRRRHRLQPPPELPRRSRTS